MNTRKLIRNIILLTGLLVISKASLAQAQEASYKKVAFKDFTVNVKEQRISIEWSVDTAVTTNYFEVQKSTDGVNYRTVMLVLGADPKQTNCNCYGCFDKFVRKGSKHSSYRLVHVSTDGTQQISEAKQINEKQFVQK